MNAKVTYRLVAFLIYRPDSQSIGIYQQKQRKRWLVWKCAGTLTDNNEWNAWKKIATDFEKRQAAYDSYNKSDFLIHLR